MILKDKIKEPVVVVVGPTAIGKTALSLQLAEQFNCEIISADSMQVYRYMDIGTAKVSRQERAQIPHHLIDIVDPDEDYDAARFAADCIDAIREIHSRARIPLVTGGTGLYISALMEGIFPNAPSDSSIRARLKQRITQEGSSKLHEELSLIDSVSAVKIHQNDTQRLVRALEVFYATGTPWSEHLKAHKRDGQLANALLLGLTCERKVLYERINLRTEMIVEGGLEKEVRALLDMGYGQELKSMGSIGYRHMVNYLNGRWTIDEMKRLLARDTRRYAKRQYTWFSKTKNLQWREVADTGGISEKVRGWLG